MQHDGKDALEALIDKTDLGTVLEWIAEICAEKADHLRTNWQDYGAAKSWELAGNVVEKARNSKHMISHR